MYAVVYTHFHNRCFCRWGRPTCRAV